MSYARREFSGSAVATALTNAIGASDTTLVIDDTSGWPSGSQGKFFVTIGRETATEEKVLVQSRSGSTLTLASSSDRGQEGTIAQAHASGETVEHTFSATDANEANYAVSQTVGQATTKGDTLVASASNVFARVGVGSNNTVFTADSSQSTGVKWSTIDGNQLSTSVAGAGLAGGGGTALSVNVDNSTLEINSDTLRAKDGGITGAKLAAGIVDNSTLEISSNTLRVKDLGITNAKLAGSIDSSKLLAGTWTTYSGTWTTTGTAPTLGNGTLTGRYTTLNKSLTFQIVLTIGSTTNVGTGFWKFDLPGGAQAVATCAQVVSAHAFDSSATNRFSGSAEVSASASIVNRVSIDGLAGTNGISGEFPSSIAFAVNDYLIIGGTIEIQ